MGRFLVVAALMLTLLACAPAKQQSPIPPGASSEDVAFLRAMDGHGISNADGSQAEIELAHRICDLLGAGMTVDGLSEHYSLTSKSDLSDGDMHYVIETAAATYCPQHVR